MLILNSIDELFEWKKSLKTNPLIGFVPTMGALHEGHLSLVRRCRAESEISIVSIFLNPKQFGVNEDLGTYPADLDGDLKKLDSMNVDVAFLPKINQMYQSDDSFLLNENIISLLLEGSSRPQFFPGVLTVVSKLFNMIMPDIAYFGKKDAQQLILIKKMVRCMKYPINVVGCDTVREHNGLAMSSRNEYLDKNIRNRAKIIYISLLEAKKMLDNGVSSVKILKEKIKSTLVCEDEMVVDYISIANLNDLVEVEGGVKGPILISVAVVFHGVRLIDNIFYN